eukprot:TRINITY_DN7289_c1_g1_i1.p1 TRINITY_DN7289_c1_g1~~TRINITY_DN7289_c1_g1_i1.p1  ORF type:complete len:554 (-),score=50.60 TRINITY_DN7289_c1_g1_i1:156-1817(-)
MIRYHTGLCGISYMGFIHGSVFPAAFKWAIPNALMAALCHYFLHEKAQTFKMDGLDYFWSGYTVTLSFLIVFRNNLAYNRYWEGAMSMAAIRGEWLNAISSALAFSNPEHKDVRGFQCLVAKLASLLYASAIHQVCRLEDDVLQVLNPKGLSAKCLHHLFECNTRSEVLTMWIERVMLQADRDKVILVAPPILSRVFQDLGNGIVQLEKIRNISEIPFPFPYAQMVAVMLVVHWLVTPTLAVVYLDSTIWAGVICFLLTGAMWSLIYIAQEIDQPFGDDANDLPVRDMMDDFNRALLDMLHENSVAIPEFQWTGDILEDPFGTWSDKHEARCTFGTNPAGSSPKLSSPPANSKMSSSSPPPSQQQQRPAPASSAPPVGTASAVVQPSDVECKVHYAAEETTRSAAQFDGIFRESAASVGSHQNSPRSDEGVPTVTLRLAEPLDLAMSPQRDIENPHSPCESRATSPNSRLQLPEAPAVVQLEGRQLQSGQAEGFSSPRVLTRGPSSEQMSSRSPSHRSVLSFEASEVRNADEPGRRANPVASSATRTMRKRDD